MASEPERVMGQLTLAQRAMLLRVACSGSLAQPDLSGMEANYAERLVEQGVLRLITVVGIVSREPVQLKQVLTYVCTPLGMQVAELLH